MGDGRGYGPPSINVRRVRFDDTVVGWFGEEQGEGMAESKITPRREEDRSISPDDDGDGSEEG